MVVFLWLVALLPEPGLASVAPDRAVEVVAHAPSGTAFDCEDIWSTGFPHTGTGLTYCLKHSRETIGGGEYRVIFPSEWATSAGWGTPYLDAATQAIRDSVAVYGALGVMSSATLVFAPLQATGAETSGADANLVSYLSDEPCAVTLYPNAELKVEAFKQIVAHELFHCFQAWNFPAQAAVDLAISDWWVDGSATYFSNLVYPGTNLEWDWIADFDARSESTPLTQFTYAATFFFQHLGNSIGDAQIISLLGSMPTGGDEGDQQAALRAWPGMDILFQGFAQAYLDGTLADTGGGAIPFSPTFSKTVASIGSGSFDVQVNPFVVRRRQLVLDPELSFSISVEVKTGTSLQAFRPDGGTWLPAPFELSCTDPRTWFSAMTSLGEAGSSTPAVLTVTVSGSDGCDPATTTDACLQGAWSVRDYEAFMVAALAMAGTDTSAMPITFEGASGGLEVNIGPDTITYTATDFRLSGSAVTQGIAIEVTLSFSGTATVTHEVSAPGVIDLIEVDPGSFAVSADTSVGGSSVGVTAMDPLDWILFATDTYQYTCTPTTLTLAVPPSTVPVILGR